MKRLLSGLVICIGLILLLTNTADAYWVQTNRPYGGIVYSFAVSGSNVFAGTGNGVFLTTNNGASWVRSGLAGTYVQELAANDSTVFAGIDDSDGVFFSTNNGASWTDVTLPNSVTSLAVSGINIFAGTDDSGIFLSTNNGTNGLWSIPASRIPLLLPLQ